jgi:hypothetical protein
MNEEIIQEILKRSEEIEVLKTKLSDETDPQEKVAMLEQLVLLSEQQFNDLNDIGGLTIIDRKYTIPEHILKLLDDDYRAFKSGGKSLLAECWQICERVQDVNFHGPDCVIALSKEGSGE